MDNGLTNSGKPWDEKDLLLVANTLPSMENVHKLCKILGRSFHAIQFMYCRIYKMSTTELKRAAKEDTTKSQMWVKLYKVKKQANIISMG